MNKEYLLKHAQDERFISGIHNYCDRWCERCPLTGRCMSFTIAEEEFSDQESRDNGNFSCLTMRGFRCQDLHKNMTAPSWD
ncbi:MAG: hypothetical protein SWE60_26245 [Thermodesulfobacteriota bacterium]|nr:hypothetical protein [Thermodesulfobacteriota bacterium]